MSAPSLPVTPSARAPQRWMAAAACARYGLDPAFRNTFTTDDPTVWDTDAVSVCAGCPVLTDCADYARRVHPPAGIWGGRRRGLRRDRDQGSCDRSGA